MSPRGWPVVRSLWPGAQVFAWRVPSERPVLHVARVTVGPGGRRGYGYDFRDAAAALEAALGEAVERTVWFDRQPRSVVPARLADLPRPLAALPTALRPWAHGAPALTAPEAADGVPVGCVPAATVVDGGQALLPLQLVAPRRPAGEPRLAWPVTSAGLAAHPSRQGALLGAVLELIERDALVGHWLLGGPLPRLALGRTGDPALDAALEGCADAGFDVDALWLPTDAPVSVVAVLASRRGPSRAAGALGLAARASPRGALLRALAEAVGFWSIAERQLAAGMAPPEDPGQLTAATRALWWAVPDRWQALRRRWLGNAMPLPDEPPDGEERTLEAIRAWLARGGHEAYVVDLLEPPLVRRAGAHVVRVVVPHLQPFYLDERQRVVHAPRLADLARLRDGACPARLAPDPHPFP